MKDKHHNWGSVLLGGGVTFAIAGPLNTFLRTGEPTHGHPPTSLVPGTAA